MESSPTNMEPLKKPSFEKEVQRFFSFFCPISQDLMSDPVVASDGHTYDRQSIIAWIEECGKRDHRQPTSPKTREVITKVLLPNLSIKQLMEEFRMEWERKAESSISQSLKLKQNLSLREAVYSADLSDVNDISTFAGALSSDIFVALDALADQIAHLDLKPPQIVIIGSENHGKSTLVERLTGFPIFPRDAKLCTLCPIRVKLRRSTAGEPQVLPKVHVHYTANVPQDVGESGFPAPVAIEMMSDFIAGLMADMRQGKDDRTIFDDREIVIEIRVPYCPNIDILDMPGLFAAPKESAEISMALSESVIRNEKDRSIFLLVVDCNTESTASLATRLVLQHKIESKTIGVFTKLDVLINEDRDMGVTNEDAFLNYLNHQSNGELQLPGGWMGCASMSRFANATTIKPLERLLLMEKREREKLQTEFKSLHEKGTFGMVAIRQRVQQEFEKFIVSEWVPNIRIHLMNQLNRLSEDWIGLGTLVITEKARGSYSEPLMLVISILSRFSGQLSFSSSTHRFVSWSVGNLGGDMSTQDFRLQVVECAKNIINNSTEWLRFDGWSFWSAVNHLNSFLVEHHESTSWCDGVKFAVLKPCDIQVAHDQAVQNLRQVVVDLERNSLDSLFNVVQTLQEVNMLGMEVDDHSEGMGLAELFTSAVDLKLSRFPALCSAFRAYLSDHLRHLLSVFRARADVFISELPVLAERKYSRSTEGLVTVNTAWVPQAFVLTDRIIDIWMETVLMSGLVDVIDKWEFTEDVIIDSCAESRTVILKEMSAAAVGLAALEDLSKRVSENK